MKQLKKYYVVTTFEYGDMNRYYFESMELATHFLREYQDRYGHEALESEYPAHEFHDLETFAFTTEADMARQFKKTVKEA